MPDLTLEQVRKLGRPAVAFHARGMYIYFPFRDAFVWFDSRPMVPVVVDEDDLALRTGWQHFFPGCDCEVCDG